MLTIGKAQPVAGFILRRLLWTIPILWVVVTIVFFMMRSIGGDPFRHGPLLGLSNVGWVKYGDYQPPAIRKNQRELYAFAFVLPDRRRLVVAVLDPADVRKAQQRPVSEGIASDRAHHEEDDGDHDPED